MSTSFNDEWKRDSIQGITIPRTEWGYNYAKLEYARIGIQKAFSTQIVVKDAADLIADRIKDWPQYDADPTHCSGFGQKYCLEAGTHSFFNHSQDSYRANGTQDNYPENFKYWDLDTL